jgi:hypothetical protein
MASQPPIVVHFGCSPNNDAVIGDLDERYAAYSSHRSRRQRKGSHIIECRIADMPLCVYGTHELDSLGIVNT